MNYLIIYDNEGTIISILGEGYKLPRGGVQYLEVTVPEGKIISGIDIETKEVILKDFPKSELQLANEKISQLEKDIADILLNMM